MKSVYLLQCCPAEDHTGSLSKRQKEETRATEEDEEEEGEDGGRREEGEEGSCRLTNYTRSARFTGDALSETIVHPRSLLYLFTLPHRSS